MPRTKIIYGEKKKVDSIVIDGKDVNEYVGRHIAMSLHSNNQEIAKAVTDTSAIINDFTEAVNLAFSENPAAKELKEYYEKMLNVTGFFSLRIGDFSRSERLYEFMLDSLRKFDGYGDAPLHKGMSFHNIALSQESFAMKVDRSTRKTAGAHVECRKKDDFIEIEHDRTCV